MKSFHYKHIPLFNFFLGITIWLLDAIIDAYIIHREENESLINAIFHAEGTELWMRLLIIIILVSVGFYAKNIIHRQELIKNELIRHKNNLEEIIQDRLAEANEKHIELERLATTDTLTSLYNRRKAQQFLTDEISRADRYNTQLSVILLDIDHFKSINDRHGHNIGDNVLTEIARLLSSSTRNTDIVARWGGEEFLITCISSNAEQAYILAENLRQNIEQHQFDELEPVTFSAGVAEYKKDKSLTDFINRADKALYLAKSIGRNRVEIAN